MKKYILILVAVLMALVAAPISAEEKPAVDVVYAVTEGYEWEVHGKIDFTSDLGVGKTQAVEAKIGNTEENGVKVTKNVIGDGKMLVISISSENGFKVKNGSTLLDYTVKKNGTGDALSQGATVLTVAAGTNTAEQKLTFTLNTGNAASEVAGNYSDHITYTAQIAD